MLRTICPPNRVDFSFCSIFRTAPSSTAIYASIVRCSLRHPYPRWHSKCKEAWDPKASRKHEPSSHQFEFESRRRGEFRLAGIEIQKRRPCRIWGALEQTLPRHRPVLLAVARTYASKIEVVKVNADLTPGSETNFFDLPGVSEWAVTMKSLSDAALLRNRVLALLEEATLQSDPAARRQLLTFVTAGGGFAGTETTGAINDFVRDTVRYYPDLNERLIRVVVIQPGDLLLPELGEELGRYAERKLCERKVEVIKGARVASYDGSLVRLSDGQSIPASTLSGRQGET